MERERGGLRDIQRASGRKEKGGKNECVDIDGWRGKRKGKRRERNRK